MSSLERIPADIIRETAMQNGLDLRTALAMQACVREVQRWQDAVDAAIDHGDPVPSLDPAIDRAMTRFENLWADIVQERPKLVLPFRKLGDVVQPLLGGEILTIAGTSGGGKTTTVMNLVYRLAEAGTRLHLIATEMHRREIYGYMVGFDTHLWPEDLMLGEHLKAGDHTGLDLPALKERTRLGTEHLSDLTDRVEGVLSVQYGDLPASALARIFADCAARGVEVIILDHLGMVDHDLPARTQYLAECLTVRQIKRLAMRHNVAVILIAQVNLTRYAEGDIMSAFKPPKVHQLFGGQQLSFISSCLLTIYRPRAEFYGPDKEPVTRPLVRAVLDRGEDISIFYERGITGYAACKLRRGARYDKRVTRLHYYRGFLSDEPFDFRGWFHRSPLDLRLEAAGRGTPGDTWEPPPADGIDREDDADKPGP